MQQSSWHVLHVLSNREKRVAQHLSVRAVEHYLPLYRERVRWTDRTVIAERPLFSGYVFARFQPQSKMIVISTPGVIRSLGDEESDMVSSAELDRIREGLESGYLLRPHLGVSAGTQVRICRGIFEGVEGVVRELRRPCKVIITITATQQSFSVEVALQDIEIIKEPFAKSNAQVYSGYNYRWTRITVPS